MKKKIGIIIGIIVVVIVVVFGIIFSTTNKQSDKNQGNDSTVSNTIDINTLDFKEYGITGEYDISDPQESPFGSAYIVRAETDNYETYAHLFILTENGILYADTKCMCIPINDYNWFRLTYADIDNKPGDEIILITNTGGNGGCGIHDISVWKIADNRLYPIEISDEEPFDVSFEAPFTVVFKNDTFNYEKKYHYKNDVDPLFTDDGTPENRFVDENDPDYCEYNGDFYPPHEIKITEDGDKTTEKCIVSLTSWSRLGKYDEEYDVYSVVDYVYNENTGKLEIHNAHIDIEALEIE